MKADAQPSRPIWLHDDAKSVMVIDQRRLPHEFVVADLRTVDDIIMAIRKMFVRGAPLIGVTGAYGVYLAALQAAAENNWRDALLRDCKKIKAARPTAINLVWAVDRLLGTFVGLDTLTDVVNAARREAAAIAEQEVVNCRRIGEHGCSLIAEIGRRKNSRPINILTHCNAGWLACVEYGTATAPIYAAYDSGIDVHVWVDETRPLNQGARLTAWELGRHGVKHTVITDNAGGHLMQHGLVDLVIVGTDRTTYTGDVANKIGTYLKALAAKDNDVPFYVALPSSTFDWHISDGVRQIPIEERDPEEIRYVQGATASGLTNVLVPPIDSPVGNYAFDVTPARLVTGFITERGICKAAAEDILKLFPERNQAA